MLSAMQSPMMMNNFAAPQMGPGPGGAAPMMQVLENLLEKLIDSTHLGAGEGPEGPCGGSPVNFGAWNNQAQNPLQANQGLGGAWNSIGSSQPQISMAASGPSTQPITDSNGKQIGDTVNTNGGAGAGGTTTVNINAKKIKNSNIIVNGQNVTANTGKKADVNGAAGQPQ